MLLDSPKKLVSTKTAERNKIRAQASSLDSQLASTTAELEYSREDLVREQAPAERAVRERYKVQNQHPSLIEVVLYAQDRQSFIAAIDYIEAASKASVGNVTSLRASIEEYEGALEVLEQLKVNVDEQLERVTSELESATEARDETRRKADLVSNARLRSDGANWRAGKKKFVAEWTPRIDAFPEGSPMVGRGRTFAEAACDNHIDPRFSPAISLIESSKGTDCIQPHNAWGWGAAEPNPAGLAASCSTWEEAIRSHVRGVKAGYGYTITVAGSKKYCPPNWQLWYSTAVSAMNSIERDERSQVPTGTVPNWTSALWRHLHNERFFRENMNDFDKTPLCATDTWSGSSVGRAAD